MDELIRWIVGLFVSLALGHVVVATFLGRLRRRLGLGSKPQTHDIAIARVPPWLTGVVERLFFTLLIAAGLTGVPTAMVGWLALKFATNWNHPAWKEVPTSRTFAFSGLLAGLLSMLFAIWGGLICGSFYRAA